MGVGTCRAYSRVAGHPSTRIPVATILDAWLVMWERLLLACNMVLHGSGRDVSQHPQAAGLPAPGRQLDGSLCPNQLREV